jgi:hypothetical protein
MEEQGFPPSQALMHNIISTYELIRMIYPIHIPIVPINGLGLVNYYISPYITCLSVGTLSLALSRVVSTDTILLSIHYKQRQGGTLSQCILPLFCFFSHCCPFFMLTGNCCGSPILSQLPAHRHQINLWIEQVMEWWIKIIKNTKDSSDGKK